MAIDREVYGYTDQSHFQQMTENMRYLWLLIKYYLLFSVYQVVYNAAAFYNAVRISADPNTLQYAKTCSVITGNLYVDEWFYFFSRGYEFFLWLFPIIFIFWKQKSGWTGQRQSHLATQSSSH